jgi:hypothetical protein
MSVFEVNRGFKKNYIWQSKDFKTKQVNL